MLFSPGLNGRRIVIAPRVLGDLGSEKLDRLFELPVFSFQFILRGIFHDQIRDGTQAFEMGPIHLPHAHEGLPDRFRHRSVDET